ncbi:hypothetical protein [Aeromonas sp. FDAARGOS 1419]|uniref:hypothetical protein n=1 Tax=Aeromonas sp. FDAARGOS 1419 TaxID=2778068 RepID=UPI001C21CC01|nr:hypothetical protein [Aeromonas sp. FDAARGOS 1419]QWZ78084.1 hypothetical protein I6L49_03630 [Aeromonas sp. FDAARGOS 1419]QWZ78091.1 hypothetical protein I6L49_03670 [Aeromonas sp. FDAARGOS 1419]
MKKSMLALALAFSASAMAANPTADIVWSGFVPGSVAGDELVITGLAGQDIRNGQLIVSTDGSFTSTPVTVEARDYDAGTSVIGDMVDANWTLSTAQVSYSGTSEVGTLVVEANDAPWDIGSALNNEKTLNLTVKQATPVDVSAGGSVQAQVTIVAEKV